MHAAMVTATMRPSVMAAAMMTTGVMAAMMTASAMAAAVMTAPTVLGNCRAREHQSTKNREGQGELA
jgi:hypothetical protein